MIRSALLAVALLLPATASVPPPDDSLSELLAHFAAAEAETREEAWSTLAARGPAAALAALDGARQAAPLARRLRARLVAKRGEAACLPGVLAWLAAGESDAEVRSELLAFLGRADLGDERMRERVEALERTALQDPERELVAQAVEALAGLRSAAAGRALDRLVDRLGAPERESAARGLELTAEGRSAVLRRVRALGESAEPPADVLGALLGVYGKALVDEPDLARSLADLAPVVAGARHPDERVRMGARLALENLVTRSARKLEVARSEELYDALERAGWSPLDLEYRRAILAMRFTDEPGRAALAARRVRERAETREGLEALRFRFFGHYLEAAALAASDRAREALPFLDRADAAIDALRAARVDLVPSTEEPPELAALDAVDSTRFSALVDLMRGVVLLLAGEPADGRAVLEVWRAVHVHLLEAQLFAARLRVDWPTDLDQLLDHNLGPRTLLYENAINPDLSRDEGIALLRDVARGLATVTRVEMPGFEPFPAPDGEAEGEPELRQPLLDPERYGLLIEHQVAQLRRYQEATFAFEGGEREQRTNRLRYRQIQMNLAEAEQREEEGATTEEAWGYLLRERAPSYLALSLARDLRLEGRPAETRALAERMRDDARAFGQIHAGLEAEIGLVIASSETEEGRADQAERTLLGVLEDLEASLDRLRADRDLAREERDAERLARYEAWVRSTERRVADCLVSLAVNANVRQGQPDKALAYFERAYELNQSEFMRGLLACYRARSGRVDEARAELREVSPTPALYYNMACTWALLGESNLALDFLERDFTENQLSRGALERQKAWAREDPDLASLRDHPRFRALVGE